jgi:hypothetical protein
VGRTFQDLHPQLESILTVSGDLPQLALVQRLFGYPLGDRHRFLELPAEAGIHFGQPPDLNGKEAEGAQQGACLMDWLHGGDTAPPSSTKRCIDSERIGTVKLSCIDPPGERCGFTAFAILRRGYNKSPYPHPYYEIDRRKLWKVLSVVWTF